MRPRSLPADLQIKFIHVRGQKLRVGLIPGPGVPLLLFNGIGGSIELLTPFVECLNRSVIIFDAPGSGESERTRLPFRPRYFARLSAELLDQLGVDQVDVLGISWGGMAAQQFCRQYFTRTRRMVLCATSMGNLMVPGRPSVLMHMAHPLRYENKDYFNRIAGKIYGGSLRTNRIAARDHARKMTPPSMLGYYFQVFALAAWTSAHWLHRIQQRTLILAGADDPIVPPINARAMHWLMPNSTLEMVDCGHLFLLTRAEKLAPRIERFLDSS
jgi:poly(3-hydroxyalkanoate) depolymerase